MPWRILPPGLYQRREESRLAVGGDLLGYGKALGTLLPSHSPHFSTLEDKGCTGCGSPSVPHQSLQLTPPPASRHPRM